MNLSKIVENKNNHIKKIQGEYSLIKNEISILTEALKKSKKQNKIAQTALTMQRKLTVDLMDLVRKDQKRFLQNDELKAKVFEIQLQLQNEPYIDLEEMPKVLKEKDGKSLSNVISPVVKKTWENPIDSQNIFH